MMLNSDRSFNTWTGRVTGGLEYRSFNTWTGRVTGPSQDHHWWVTVQSGGQGGGQRGGEEDEGLRPIRL